MSGFIQLVLPWTLTQLASLLFAECSGETAAVTLGREADVGVLTPFENLLHFHPKY